MSFAEKSERAKSTTHRAAEEIRQLIFSGELTAGSNHLESELATRLGISRTPVREATLMLQASGLLEVQPRKGVRIAALSADDMQEIYVILTEMECLAVRLAVEVDHPAAAFDPLKRSLEAMIEALNTNDLPRWAQADELFHAQLVELSQSERLIRLVENFNDQVRRARAVTLNLRPEPSQSVDDHTRVYNAMLAGDPQTATELHRQHCVSARTMLVQILRQSGLKRV